MFRAQTAQMFLHTQDIMSQRTAGKQDVLYIVINGIARRVAVTVGLLEDYVTLTLNLVFRER